MILPGIVTSIIGFQLVDTRVAVPGNLVGLPISFAYYIYLEGNYGQTLGKMALDLVVLTETVSPSISEQPPSGRYCESSTCYRYCTSSASSWYSSPIASNGSAIWRPIPSSAPNERRSLI